jgi:hypothetical protein
VSRESPTDVRSDDHDDVNGRATTMTGEPEPPNSAAQDQPAEGSEIPEAGPGAERASSHPPASEEEHESGRGNASSA